MKTKSFFYFFLLFLLFLSLTPGAVENQNTSLFPTPDDGQWFFLKDEDMTNGGYHTRHAEIFGKYVTGYNSYVLKGIDKVQETAPQGGGYFIGVKAAPPESPIGYPLKLFGLPILNPPRTTSYCSGSSYAAFIEALNMILPDGAKRLTLDRFEAMRMQEPDGGRREDGVKFWGHWNADGLGTHFALAQYSKMGEAIEPKRARPGDFMNILWKKGVGHSVVFLGWIPSRDNKEMRIAYWSSQAESNGFADAYSTGISLVKSVKTIRLTRPENIFQFNINEPVVTAISGDPISP